MTKDNELIKIGNSRPTIEVHLSDGRVLNGPRGLAVGEFLKVLPEFYEPLTVGAIVNAELRELTFPLTMDSHVKPVTMADDDGSRIYRRSAIFLLEAVFEQLYPQASLLVDHSVSSGGFYCRVTGRSELTTAELLNLEKRMQDLVVADLPFERKQVPLSEAINYYKSKNYDDKVRLLSYRQKDWLVLYNLGDHRDYHHGYLVPSTGYLRWLALAPAGEGFMLRFPRRHAPKELLPMPDNSKLLNTFRQYGNWLARLGIENVGILNDALQAGRAREIILVSEALHEQQIANIAADITARGEKVKVVLIAGPSSSGKTTFSKRLVVQLLSQGVAPVALELDNYFVDREKTPKDEAGEYDFESLYALDRDLLSQHLKALIRGDEIQIPRYDFRLGKSTPGDIYRLKPGEIVILEGIHGLNPNLLPSIPIDQTYRIYVSCLTQLNLDRNNRISTTDSRLMRRIVRDARDRGYNAMQTVQRWQSVRRGEKEHIFPYQENADVMFNSALVYELSALKPLVEPLLRQVPFGTAEYIEAKRLLAFLEWFLPIEIDLIPDNSILREFIGGSILKEFKLWQM